MCGPNQHHCKICEFSVVYRRKCNFNLQLTVQVCLLQEGNVLTHVCLSVYRGVPRPCPDRGVPGQVQMGCNPGRSRWGIPQQGPDRRYPSQVQMGVPQQGPDRRYPGQVQMGGYPSQVQMGVPWPGLDGGYPSQVHTG